MQQQSEFKKGARIYYIRSVIAAVAYAVLFYACAGTTAVPRAWWYFSILFFFVVVSNGYFYRSHPALLHHRNQWKKDASRWDKVITPVMVLTGIHLQYVVMGLHVRWAWPTLELAFFFPGMILLLASLLWSAWAMWVNPHFEATVRIQKERDHRVVDTGPYRWVRHPGYLGFMGTMIAAPMVIGAASGFVNTALAVILIMVRTRLEDKTLQKQLEGYTDYARRVRFRLLPGLW